jgi:taurine dioxygenase
MINPKPLSDAIGVEISGIDLREPLTNSQVSELRDLLDRHHLISFPGQGLSPEEQIAFTSQFGPVTSDGDGDQLYGYISNQRMDSGVHADSALLWHSDNGWSPAPTYYIALGGSRVVGRLAPTSFANSVRAAQLLPPQLRARIAGLKTINVADLAPLPEGDVPPSQKLLSEVRRVRQIPEDDYYYPRWSYPLIWQHPRTGAELLPVYEDFSVCIEGMTPFESEEIYTQLFAILYDEANVYHHHWRQDDLVIWDNIALQHGRPAFKGANGERTLLRTTINPDKESYLRHARRVADFGEMLRSQAAAPPS